MTEAAESVNIHTNQDALVRPGRGAEVLPPPP